MEHVGSKNWLYFGYTRIFVSHCSQGDIGYRSAIELVLHPGGLEPATL